MALSDISASTKYHPQFFDRPEVLGTTHNKDLTGFPSVAIRKSGMLLHAAIVDV